MSATPAPPAEPTGTVWRCGRCKHRIGIIRGDTVDIHAAGLHVSISGGITQHRCAHCGLYNYWPRPLDDGAGPMGHT